MGFAVQCCSLLLKMAVHMVHTCCKALRNNSCWRSWWHQLCTSAHSSDSAHFFWLSGSFNMGWLVAEQLKHSAANQKVAWLEHWQGSINMPLVQDTRDRLTWVTAVRTPPPSAHIDPMCTWSSHSVCVQQAIKHWLASRRLVCRKLRFSIFSTALIRRQVQWPETLVEWVSWQGGI